jgi:transposase
MVGTIICGIDAHDNTLTCCIGVDRESPEVRGIKNTRRGREWLILYLKYLVEGNEEARIIVAYEASTLGFGINDHLGAAGIECHVLAPTKMPKTAKDRKKKTDKRDAERIFEMLRAHVLAGNKLPDIWIPDHQTRDDRETVRARLDVGKKLTSIKNQVQTLLKRNGVVKPEEAGNSWTKPYRKWLRDLELPKGSRNALSSLLRQIACLEQEIKILDMEVVALSETDRYYAASKELVERIKGVGLLTAMVFLTELGDMNRFNNRKAVGSFLGLVPSSNESGETDDRKGHITREGPARVRRVLCQATWSRVANDKREAKVYDRIVEKNPKHKKIAVVASMRRLGVLMWHIAREAQGKAASPQIQDERNCTTYAMRA